MRAERQILFWVLLGAGFIALIALLQDILLPFVAGIAIAYFLAPMVDGAERLGVPRWLSSAFVVLSVGLLIALALIFLVPFLVDQATRLAAALPDLIERARTLIVAVARDLLGERFDQVESELRAALSGSAKSLANSTIELVSSVLSRGVALLNFVSVLLITPIVVFYVLVDWHPMLNRIDGWLPRDHAHTLRRLAGDINRAIAAFVRGQGTIALVLALIYSVGLSWVGLKYGLLIGLTAGLLSFVPFVGFALGIVTAAIMALVQAWPDPMLLVMVVGVFALGQALDAGYLSPKIVGSRVGLHPVWLIFSLFVFSYLFGFVGTLVAVPVAAAIGVLVRFAVEVYLDSDLYRGRGADDDDRSQRAGAVVPGSATSGAGDLGAAPATTAAREAAPATKVTS